MKRLGRGCTNCAVRWCDQVVTDWPARLNYVGGPEEGKRGHAIEKMLIVVVAAEKNGRAIGRIRLKRVKDVSAESLLGFIRDVVEPGATPHTGGWKGYAGLSAAGYKVCNRRSQVNLAGRNGVGIQRVAEFCQRCGSNSSIRLAG